MDKEKVKKRISEVFKGKFNTIYIPDTLAEYWLNETDKDLDVYGLDDFIQMNIDDEIFKIAPSFFIIGNDSGNQRAFIKNNGEDDYVYFGYIDEIYEDKIKKSEFVLMDWLNGGAIYPDGEIQEYSSVQDVILVLYNLPRGGMTETRKLLKTIGLSMPLSETKKLSESLPMEMSLLPYIKALRIVDEFNLGSSDVKLINPDNKSMEFPIDFKF